MTTLSERPARYEKIKEPGGPLDSMNAIGEGATPLMYACQQSKDQEVRTIISKKPAAVRERDRTLKTPLHYCAENVTLTCADLILSAAHDLLNAKDEDGYTALHLAVIAGNKAFIKYLIAKGADVNCLDNERHSVVHWATVCGEVEALELVLEAGASASTPDIHGGYPIHYAAQMCGPNSEMGNDVRYGLAVLRKLLAHNVEVNVTDQDGRQPILWAASAAAVYRLLYLHADSPSGPSCPSGSADAILALVNAGAKVEAHDKDGLTALHCAASRGHTDCIETLVSLCGAEVDVIDSNGCTALFYAVTLGHADSTQLLLTYGFEPNRQDRKGRTPAHCGASKGQLETLRILSKHGANLWIRNVKGDYPLHEAVASGRKDLIRWLLSQRPEAVNAANNDGRCPLHVAAIYNNIEVCKILLDAGSLVNPVMRSSKGQLMTPLDAALHRGNRGCAKYLQLHGGVPANKLTDKAAKLRGISHRDRILIESQSENFTTPEFVTTLPVPGGRTPIGSSPMEDADRLKALQVRLNDDIAIQHVERIEGPIICRHYYDDSSDEERMRRRRRRRRKRSEYRDSEDVDDDVRWRRRNKYSDNESDSDRRVIRRRRRDKRGSVSDRESYRRGRTRRRGKRLSTSDTELSDDDEEEDDDDDDESEYDEVIRKKRTVRDRKKPSGESNQNKSNEDDVKYLEVKKTTIKTKKTKVLSKTDEEEVKETQEELEKSTEETERNSSKLDVEDSKIERSESREREVIKKTTETVTSSIVKGKKPKTKAKDKEVEKTKTKHTEQASDKNNQETKGSKKKVGVRKNDVKDKKASEKPNRKIVQKKSSLGKDSTKSTNEEVNDKQNEEKHDHIMEDVTVSRNNTDNIVQEMVTTSMDESGDVTQTIVTALVHRQELTEESSIKSEASQDTLQKEQENETTDNEKVDANKVSANDAYENSHQLENTVESTQILKESHLEDKQTSDTVVCEKKEDQETDETLLNHETVSTINSANNIKATEIIESDNIEKTTGNVGNTENIAKIDNDTQSKEQVSAEQNETVETNTVCNETVSQNIAECALDEQCETKSNEDKVKKDFADEISEIDTEKSKSEKQLSDTEANKSRSEKQNITDDISESEAIRSSPHTDDEAQELEKDEEEDDEEVVSVLEKGRPFSVEKAGTTRTSATSSLIEGIDDGDEENLESLASTSKSRNGDSGFEPSPRHSKAQRHDSSDYSRQTRRISRPCRTEKEEDRPPITPSSVTRAVQNSMRKYHLERRIFQELLELKRLQIRAGRANEQVLVKRLVDNYRKAGLTVCLKQYEGSYTFRNFEKYLYDQLRMLQTSDKRLIPRLKSSDDFEKLTAALRKAKLNNKLKDEDIPENPILCTHGTHRCHHAVHAYTGIPCAAYITKFNHHSIPKSSPSGKSSFLPRIDSSASNKVSQGFPRTMRYVDPSRPVTLELTHGNERQIISLPTERLDKNKRYYVTFTIKGGTNETDNQKENERMKSAEQIGHRHSDSL